MENSKLQKIQKILSRVVAVPPAIVSLRRLIRHHASGTSGVRRALVLHFLKPSCTKTGVRARLVTIYDGLHPPLKRGREEDCGDLES